MNPLQSLFGDDAVVLRETNFQLLLLATVFPVLGESLVSPVLDSLTGPFGTSAANISLIVASFAAPQILIVPVAGVLADRYGRKRVMVSGLLLFGVSGAAIAFTTNFIVVLGLRLLQGVGSAGINPIIITSIGDSYDGPREATGQGLRFMGSGLSGMVLPLVSGLLVVLAWQYPFLLYGLAIPAAVAMHRWFDEPTNSGTDTANNNQGSYRRDLLRLTRRRRVLAVILARTSPTVIWIGFLTYNSFVVTQLLGGTPPQAGLLAAVLNGMFAVSASQAGRITELFDSRLLPLVGANACLTVGYIVVLFAPGIPVAVAGIAVVGVGFGVTLSLYRSIITGFAPDELRAGLVGFAEATGRAVRTLTPVAMGATIAVMAPTVGIPIAIMYVSVGAAVVGGFGGILCLLVAHASEPTPAERATATGR